MPVAQKHYRVTIDSILYLNDLTDAEIKKDLRYNPFKELVGYPVYADIIRMQKELFELLKQDASAMDEMMRTVFYAQLDDVGDEDAFKDAEASLKTRREEDIWMTVIQNMHPEDASKMLAAISSDAVYEATHHIQERFGRHVSDVRFFEGAIGKGPGSVLAQKTFSVVIDVIVQLDDMEDADFTEDERICESLETWTGESWRGEMARIQKDLFKRLKQNPSALDEMLRHTFYSLFQDTLQTKTFQAAVEAVEIRSDEEILAPLMQRLRMEDTQALFEGIKAECLYDVTGHITERFAGRVTGVRIVEKSAEV